MKINIHESSDRGKERDNKHTEVDINDILYYEYNAYFKTFYMYTKDNLKGIFFRKEKNEHLIEDFNKLDYPTFNFYCDEHGEKYTFFINTNYLSRIYTLTEKNDTITYGFTTPLYIFEFIGGKKIIKRCDHTSNLSKELKDCFYKRIVTETFERVEFEEYHVRRDLKEDKTTEQLLTSFTVTL